jgi:molecular chaperone GrpE
MRNPIIHIVHPNLCGYCERFFAQYACSAALGECDCPRCQGLCECDLPDNAPDDDERFVAVDGVRRLSLGAVPMEPLVSPDLPAVPVDPDAAWATTLAEAGLPPEHNLAWTDMGPVSELADTTERLVRMTAEFENYRKRVERSRIDAVDALVADLVSELLAVADDLERGMAHGDDSRRAFALIHTRLLSVLKRRGVEPFTSVGRPFDPNVHQAVVVEEVSDRPSGIVSGELARGYRRGDKLVRAAMVKVTRRV